MKRWMTVLAAVLMVAAGSLTTTGTALAASEPDDIMNNATSVLDQFVNIPENKIPSALLQQAYGIAVIPSVFKAGFIGGVQYGKGVLSVRTSDGSWSDPTFIKLYGGSFGFQAGVSSTDLILVFKTRRSVDRLADGEFTLGADASVAAGPVGRRAGASTNLSFDAEVYSYSRSRGLFAGVALNGARLGIAQDANWLYYDQAGIDARTLLNRSSGSNLPQSGQRFIYTLNQYMPASNDQFHYGSNTGGGSMNSGYTGAGSNRSANSQGYGQTYGQTTPYNGGAGGGVTVQQNGNVNGASNYGSGSYNNGAANNNSYNSRQNGGTGSNGY
ncbi:lipid-binding SYLF domain-containing protein [Salinisphaera sp.]|uniref:lipid-binding SYLF domain-containing protein n=1 Tax=Salinisphaera sp. TaxID=1914330 RepID=UPI002D76B9B0|nr:YSC84-related protein [Salinisphaera sp.]HET7312821.1 YSC84-related protein [Salinisphaera sp.]